MYHRRAGRGANRPQQQQGPREMPGYDYPPIYEVYDSDDYEAHEVSVSQGRHTAWDVSYVLF